MSNTYVVTNPNNPTLSDLWKDVVKLDSNNQPITDEQGRIQVERHVVRGSVGINQDTLDSSISTVNASITTVNTKVTNLESSVDTKLTALDDKIQNQLENLELGPNISVKTTEPTLENDSAALFPVTNQLVDPIDNASLPINEIYSSKADVDLSNLSNTGDIKLAHNAMPNCASRTQLVTPTTSGQTYIAPADGYFAFSFKPIANTNYACHMFTSNSSNGGLNFSYSGNSANTAYQMLSLPIAKGDTLTIIWSNCTPDDLFFWYANGAVSEIPQA